MPLSSIRTKTVSFCFIGTKKRLIYSLFISDTVR